MPYSWLRSANYNNYNNSYRLAADGSTMNNNNVNNSNAVRPALHSLAIRQGIPAFVSIKVERTDKIEMKETFVLFLPTRLAAKTKQSLVL